MERAAHKTCPSSRDHTKLKAAFQQYEDANTNWKDVLLAYRADKFKEWNQAADVITMTALAGSFMRIALSKRSRCDETTAEKLRRNKAHDRAVPKWLKAKAHEVPKLTIHRWKRYLSRDPPSYDSGIPLSEAVAKIMMDKIEARSKWLDPGSRNTPLYGEAPPYMGSKVIRQLYEDVVDWQSQRCISSIPSRHSLDEEERRLGCRLQHALIRRYRDPPLANVDTSLINTCLLYTSPSPRDS